MKRYMMLLLMMIVPLSVFAGGYRFPITYTWYMDDSTGTSVTDSIYYKMVLSTDSLFSTIVFSDSMVPDKYNGRTRIFPDTTYYVQTDTTALIYEKWLWWRVNARYTSGLYKGGVSGWSKTGKFIVYHPQLIVGSEPHLLRIYPNPPTNKLVNVDFYVANPGRVTLTLHDIVGKVVVSLVFDGMTSGQKMVSMDLAPLPIGEYVCVVENNNVKLMSSLVLK